jgi:hypothetical protein
MGIGLTGFVGAALIGMLVDAELRTGRYYNEPAKLVQAIGVSELALVPSGRNLRHPSLHRRAVDLRYDPRLPFEVLHEAGLLLAPGSKPGK